VDIKGPFPFIGEVVWLTPDQGGRRSGPPGDPRGYASVAHVPPHDAKTGSASFVVAGFDPTLWRSAARARWLAVANEGDQCISAVDVVVVTEGVRAVAFFIVDEVDSDE